ncbi:MAG: hypothetical protein ABI592_12490 [Acidobacteriota bacterium]
MFSPRLPLRRVRVGLLGIAVLLLAALPAAAALRAADDAISLVPPDAASVAVVRFNELRSSPLASRLFTDVDHMSGNGEAARFMDEANLKPREDVDTVVIVGLSPAAGGTDAPVLALFEGRFDPQRLAAAATTRGASKIAGASGDYYLLPRNEGRHSSAAAVAFASPRLMIAGGPSAVEQALAARASGGTAFASGAGLGGQLSRIDRTSSVWALVDVTRYPSVKRGMNRSVQGGSEAAGALIGAMKSVTLFSFQATVHTDELTLAASGVSPDADTRQLLEDSLKGVVAMWRLAVQEKQPELVSALRRFRIESSGDAVTVTGTLPGAVLRSLAEKRTAMR